MYLKTKQTNKKFMFKKIFLKLLKINDSSLIRLIISRLARIF